MKNIKFGHCVNCDKRIAEITPAGRLKTYPEYRNAFFDLQSTLNKKTYSSRMKVAVCNQCHNMTRKEKEVVLTRQIQTWCDEITHSLRFNAKEKTKWKAYHETFKLK